MSIYILLLFAFVAFAFLVLVRKWHDYAMLFTVAIGCAVNANIFNSVTSPVLVGEFVFSVDAILYTLFMFTVIICAKDYDIRRAKILTSSAIAAILVSAVIEFFANWSTLGFSLDLLVKLDSYISSCIGTFLGVWTMLWVFNKMENKKVNINITFVVCVLIASIINSTIYYTGAILVSGEINNLLYILIGSYAGKMFCIVLGQIAYYINTHFWIPNNLKDKYPVKKNAETLAPPPQPIEQKINKPKAERKTRKIQEQNLQKNKKIKVKNTNA